MKSFVTHFILRPRRSAAAALATFGVYCLSVGLAPGACGQTPILARPYPVSNPVLARSTTTGERLVVVEEGLPGQPVRVSAWQLDATLRNPRLLMLEDGMRPTASFVAVSNSWVIAYEARENGRDGTRLHAIRVGAAMGSGQRVFLPGHAHPRLGGYADPRARSSFALLATENRLAAETWSVDVFSVETIFLLPVFNKRFIHLDNRLVRPAITALVWNESSPWILAMQTSAGRLGFARRTAQLGSWEADSVPYDDGYPAFRPRYEPRIAGDFGSYVLAYVQGFAPHTGRGPVVRTQRLVWPEGRSLRFEDERLLVSGNALGLDGLAFDHGSGGRYALAVRGDLTASVHELNSLGFYQRSVALPSRVSDSAIAVLWDGTDALRYAYADLQLFPVVFTAVLSR